MRYLLLILMLTFGCDQLGSKTQGVGVITRTPDLTQAEQLDPQLAPYLPVAQLVNNGATAAAFALGVRDSLTSTDITGISSANITVTWNGATVGLCSQATAGTYAATSISTATCGDARLSYDQDTQYTFDIGTAGDQYTVRVTAPEPLSAVTITPPIDAITDVNGAGLPRHDRNTPLKLDWSASGVNRPAFVAVFRIDYVGGPGQALSGTSWRVAPNNPVYNNAPTSIGDYVALLLDDTPPTSFTIPRETFGASGLYLTVITPVGISTDVSSNLSLGSGALAGAGTAFAFWVD